MFIEEKINRFKKKRNAVILAHNYQNGQVQDIADFVGDSLELSRLASETDADVIIFCGVHFMAETASILSPEKTVLLPNMEAGCPMADMITRDQLIALKEEHPKAIAVGYVNTSAAVKSELDICCTSSNAVKVIESIETSKEIIFIPDKFLGHFVSKQTKRELILWPGYCPTHAKITPGHILEMRKEHPGAEVLVHPECSPLVTDLADKVLSTGGMLRYSKESQADKLIIGTETGILHRLRKQNPGKLFFPATEKAICPNMKKITLERILWALEGDNNIVKVPANIQVKAKKSLDAMLEIM